MSKLDHSTYTSKIETSPVTILHNVIIWFDGTIRPHKNHHQCSGVWEYDGQVHYHVCKRTKKGDKDD